MNDTELLQELVLAWTLAAPVGPRDIADEVPTIPAGLLTTVTTREPFRTQVLADVGIYLNCPSMTGIGLICQIAEPLAIVAGEGWEKTIQPLRFKLAWSGSMGGDHDEYKAYTGTFQRVAWEGDGWKVVGLWNQTDRSSTLEVIEFFKKAYPRRRQPAPSKPPLPLASDFPVGTEFFIKEFTVPLVKIPVQGWLNWFGGKPRPHDASTLRVDNHWPADSFAEWQKAVADSLPSPQ